MEQRKLIRLGNSSFAIALPKNWVKKSGLKKGDDVFITPNSNGELIIQPEFKKIRDEKEVIIATGNKDEKEIGREVISAYISGYNLIKILGEEKEIKNVKEKIKKLLHLELIEADKKKAVFKDLLDIEEIGIERFLRRMDSNIKDMFSNLSSMVKEGKKLKERTKEIEEIDEDITKFYFLIWRLMNLGIENPALQTALKMSPKSFVVLFWVSYNLEQIGDALKMIARKINNVNRGKECLKDVLNLTLNNYNKSIEAFFNKNKNLSKEIILRKDETTNVCEKLLRIKGFEILAEKLQQINLNIHNNSKMIFYNL